MSVTSVLTSKKKPTSRGRFWFCRCASGHDVDALCAVEHLPRPVEEPKFVKDLAALIINHGEHEVGDVVALVDRGRIVDARQTEAISLCETLVPERPAGRRMVTLEHPFDGAHVFTPFRDGVAIRLHAQRVADVFLPYLVHGEVATAEQAFFWRAVRADGVFKRPSSFCNVIGLGPAVIDFAFRVEHPIFPECDS